MSIRMLIRISILRSEIESQLRSELEAQKALTAETKAEGARQLQEVPPPCANALNVPIL